MRWMKTGFIFFIVYLSCATSTKADSDDLFYRDFLLQSIRIAVIRELQGDPEAGLRIEKLKQLANRSRIKLPSWADRELRVRKVKYKDLNNIRVPKPDDGKFERIILKTARAYALPPALIKAVIFVESDFNNNIVSKKGAQGLMQLMPETAKDLGVVNPFNPWDNINGGVRLLKQHLTKFGSLKKALIAYNAGPRYVIEKRMLPRETRKYIKKVIKYYRKYMDKRDNRIVVR